MDYSGLERELLTHLDGHPVYISRSVRVPARDLVANDWNYSEASQQESRAISQSLATYGQVLELIVRPHPGNAEKLEIIDGEKRFINSTGYAICHVVHGVPDAHAKKLTIIMNETRGHANPAKLRLILSDLQKEMPSQSVRIALPWSEHDMANQRRLRFAVSEDDVFGGDRPGTVEDEEGWVTFSVKMPRSAYEVFMQAREAIDAEVGLHPNWAIANGRAVELIAADYLGGSGQSR